MYKTDSTDLFEDGNIKKCKECGLVYSGETHYCKKQGTVKPYFQRRGSISDSHSLGDIYGS